MTEINGCTRGILLSVFILTEIFTGSKVTGSAPTVLLDNEVVSWPYGKVLTLRSHVLSATEVESVYWEFEDGKGFHIINDETDPSKYSGSTVDNPSLTIRNLTISDEGAYTCAATNKFGTGKSKPPLNLNVIDRPPSITLPQIYYLTSPARDIQLNCTVTSSSQLLSVDWTFDNVTHVVLINLTENDKYGGGSLANPSLKIFNITDKDVGVYTCRVGNKYGHAASPPIRLELTGEKPIVTVNQTQYYANVWNNIVLQCFLLSPSTEITSVYWTFDDGNTVSVVRHSIYDTDNSKYGGCTINSPSLEIYNLTSNDEGFYRCSSTNIFGQGHGNITFLTVEDLPIVSVSSGHFNANFGSAVALGCEVHSNSIVQYVYWIRNVSGEIKTITSDLPGIDGVSKENPSLTILVATDTDSGFYTCFAANEDGLGRSTSAELIVKGDIPVVNVNSTMISTLYGSSVTLSVTIYSAPFHVQVYWTKEKDDYSEIIHPGSVNTRGGNLTVPSLTIGFPTQTDEGLYTCHAENIIGTATSKTMHLFVIGDVPFVSVNTTMYTSKYGASMTFECNITSSPNCTEVYWEKTANNIKTRITPDTSGILGSTVTTPSLTIRYVTSSDAGSYICFGVNALGVGASRETRLSVEASFPIVEVSAVMYTTLFGSSVTLDCKVIAEPPAFHIFWIKKEKNGFLSTITDGAVGTEGITPETPSLSIMFPTSSDSGEYRCYAVNDLGQRGSLSTLLKVIGDSPSVTVTQITNNVNYGELFTIDCKVSANPFHWNVYWEHHTTGRVKKIRRDTPGVQGITVDNPSITITTVRTSDSGTYMCVAENLVGEGKSQPVHILVNGGIPVVDVASSSYSVKDGNDVSLLCVVSGFPRHTDVYWRKATEYVDIILNNGSTGTIGLTASNPSLTLKPAYVTDTGLYTCFAINSVGTSSSRAISLKVVSEKDAVPATDESEDDTETIVNGVIGGVSAVGAIAAVIVAWIAFKHAKKSDGQGTTRTDEKKHICGTCIRTLRCCKNPGSIYKVQEDNDHDDDNRTSQTSI